jgi:hypothetical protein
MLKNELEMNKVSDRPNHQNPFESRVDHIFVGKFKEGTGSFAARLVYCQGDTLAFEKRNGMRFLIDLKELRGLYELPPKDGE